MAPNPAVLPIQQTSSRRRPAGIDLPVQPNAPLPDAFRPPAPAHSPMVPIAVPAPPQAPPELAAPVAPALDPAVWGLDVDATPEPGRRRAPGDADAERRARRKPPPPKTAKLAGRGKAGAARLLVLALVVGAEGIAVTAMAGPAKTAPAQPTELNASEASAAFDAPSQLPATAVLADSAQRQQSAVNAQADALALAQKQSESSLAKVTAAIGQAKAAAARVKAAADRRERAMRNAQRDPRSVAKILLADHGWSSSQFSCLNLLWNRESQWNYRAYNPGSGAYGIPQALPGSKMASAGSDWRTNPVTQMKWGLNYIADRYGTPCAAWGHSQNTGWY